jgi:hypothetical protein
VGGAPATLSITVPNSVINGLSSSNLLSVQGSVYLFQPGAASILNSAATFSLVPCMSPARFPARKADGSFCVEIGVQMTDLQIDFVSCVQTWINDAWMPQHGTWTREWKTGSNLATRQVQELRYDDEFMGPPEVAAGSASELQLRLRGKKTAKFWKDWVVSRLMPDLKAQFPGVGELIYLRDFTE